MLGIRFSRLRLLPCTAAVLALSAATLAAPAVATGADRLLEKPYLSWLQGRRIGIITNQTGLTRDFESVVQLLERQPGLRVTALFAPEHGLFGQAQAGEKLDSHQRVYSLYGEHRAPTPEMLQDVDLLLYDIQDVGARFYTFISTLFESMKAAAQAQIPFVVLDRPNPVGGERVEGPVLEAGMESFVGIFPLPIRYGMTVGELARLFNQEAGLGADLRIVPSRGWKRAQWFDDTGLPWIAPSPNMPTLETATVYPGFCLIEGTNLSEGRGTTRPFQLVGAPWLDAARLAGRLQRLSLPGVRFRPQAFTPTFSKYRGELCQGIQVHVTDRKHFQPVETAIHFLAEVRQLHPGQFEILESFDRLAGNTWMGQQLTDGAPAAALISRWQPALRQFETLRAKYLLYR